MQKFMIIAESLATEIENGILKKGDRLPAERELQSKFGASRHAIREALEILTKKGYTRSIKGSGTYVINETAFRALDIISSDRLLENTLSTEILFFEKTIPTKKIKDYLELKDEDEIFHWIRLRKENEVPFQLEETYVSVELFSKLKEKDLENSFYRYIEEKAGYKISHSLKEIKAVNLNHEESEIFQVPYREAAIKISQIGYLKNGKIFEYSDTVQYNRPFKHFAKKI